MKLKVVLPLSLIILIMNFTRTANGQIQIGIFADCQYCDCETAGSRFYRNSLDKLHECIQQFNQNKKIEFVVGLGDLIDRNFASFDSVNKVLSTSKKDIFQVVGNHDLAVETKYLSRVPEKLNLTTTWYTFTKKDWQFIFLDGNEITIHSANAETVKQAENMLQKLKQENKPNAQEWNGGIGKNQLNWLEDQLKSASEMKKKVAVFCHYPLLPFEAHALWNSDEVLSVLKKYSCVKLWINGHNHAGNYVFQNGIHFINFRGMVETENENAFAEIILKNNEVEVKAYGRELNRILPIE